MVQARRPARDRVFDVEGDDLLTTRDVIIDRGSRWAPRWSSRTPSWPRSAGGGRSSRGDRRSGGGVMGGADRRCSVAIVLATDYADLATRASRYVVALLVATQFVGLGRGGHVPRHRGDGAARPRAHRGQGGALVRVIFGAVHLEQRARHRGEGACRRRSRSARRLLLLPDPTGLRRQRPQLGDARAVRLLDPQRDRESSPTRRGHVGTVAVIARLPRARRHPARPPAPDRARRRSPRSACQQLR